MAAIMPALQTPKCSICKTTFNKMEYMNTHMKTVHGKSDHEIIDRLFKTVTSVRTKEPIKEVTLKIKKLHSLKIRTHTMLDIISTAMILRRIHQRISVTYVTRCCQIKLRSPITCSFSTPSETAGLSVTTVSTGALNSWSFANI